MEETSQGWFEEAERQDDLARNTKCLPGDPCLMLFVREREFALNRAAELEREGR